MAKRKGDDGSAREALGRLIAEPVVLDNPRARQWTTGSPLPGREPLPGATLVFWNRNPWPPLRVVK